MGKKELLQHIYKYLLLLTLLVSQAYAQDQFVAFDLDYPTDSSEIKKNHWKFLFGFDARTSWVLGEKTALAGLKIGATVNKKHKFGIGLYFLKRPIIRGEVYLDQSIYPYASDTTSYNFGYSSFFYEYIWYNSKRLSFSTPFHLGTATVTASYLRNDTIAPNSDVIT